MTSKPIAEDEPTDLDRILGCLSRSDRAIIEKLGAEIERLRPLAESWESYEAAQDRKAQMRQDDIPLRTALRQLVGAVDCIEWDCLAGKQYGRLDEVRSTARALLSGDSSPVETSTPLSQKHAKRILQDWIEDTDHAAIIKDGTWPDLAEAYDALKAIADGSPVEPTRCTCVVGKLNWCAIHSENGDD